MQGSHQQGEATDPRIGKRIGRYLITARVADGSTGRVYEARLTDPEPEDIERVAVKVLHDEIACDPVAMERFRREFEAAREMQHPHIVRVLDFGHTREGLPFLAMEYLEGEELGALLRREGKLPAARVVPILCQLAVALEYAHSFGFIHRDLKPSNIFVQRVGEQDRVSLLDFGSVKLQMDMGPKLTALGTTLGSPYYMSPEQAQGRLDVDQRTDVFAMGAIIYELLTGQAAFEAPSVAQIMLRVLHDRPVPASERAGVLPVIDDVLERALHKDKGQRFATVLDFAEAFLTALQLRDTPRHWAERSALDVAAAMAQPQGPASSGPRPASAESPEKSPVKSSRPPSPIRAPLAWLVWASVMAMVLLALGWLWSR